MCRPAPSVLPRIPVVSVGVVGYKGRLQRLRVELSDGSIWEGLEQGDGYASWKRKNKTMNQENPKPYRPDVLCNPECLQEVLSAARAYKRDGELTSDEWYALDHAISVLQESINKTF